MPFGTDKELWGRGMGRGGGQNPKTALDKLHRVPVPFHKASPGAPKTTLSYLKLTCLMRLQLPNHIDMELNLKCWNVFPLMVAEPTVHLVMN